MEPGGSYRRLIRLVIGLALVVVVMKQVSNEAIYRPFFGGGEPQPRIPSAANGGAATPSLVRIRPIDDSGANTAQASAVESVGFEDRKVASDLVARVGVEKQRKWSAGLTRLLSGKQGQSEDIESTATAIADELASMPESDSVLAWQDSAGRWGTAETLTEHALTKQTRGQIDAMLSALDAAAMNRVVDGSVWRSGDFDAFYRLLYQATVAPAETFSGPAAVVGAVPLLQQPAVFQGQRVAVTGTVARAERIVARENAMGITDYWQLWLRPSDGADRPIVAIVPNVGDPIARVGSDATREDGPPVRLTGIFLKRLAYQSSVGADLAPVIIGQLDERSETSTRSESVVAKQAPSDDSIRRQLGWTAAAACIIGIGLAAIVSWRSTVMTRRTRELRASGRPSTEDLFIDIQASIPASAASSEEPS
ncbi:hypothetical protein Poly51_18820 [Rubripirellula tenax]|uniref:Uncharacterized protein n=2 Tax=Rubripirellula tenax TaxID=2528015 RepID=A0A5C6FG92_9BACT|nr:hypothetical protein Poly51_18820 [Rubripirellula tenax]